MNKGVIALISFILGGAAGVGGTYLFLKRKYEKMIDDEVDEVVKYYKEKEEAENTETDKKDVQEEKEESHDDTPKIHRIAKPNKTDVKDYEEIIEKLNYNKYSTVVSDSHPDPYIISANEYNEDAYTYEKVDVSWFLDDEVLMNVDTDEVILDVNKHVGFGNLELFGKSDGADDDELYIRNELLGIDYHVILETGSYTNYIASLGE